MPVLVLCQTCRVCGCQTVCKPGSVRRASPHGPSAPGRPFIWDVRYRTPHATDPGGDAETRPAPEHCSRACRPYLVLLPVGFTLPVPLPGPRCALTAPFHPCRPALAGGQAVCFLWHFPWGRPRRPLAGTVFPWSPDFPPPPRGARAAVRPSGTAGLAGARGGGPCQAVSHASQRAIAAVSPSNCPSMSRGRKRRWTALSTACGSSSR